LEAISYFSGRFDWDIHHSRSVVVRVPAQLDIVFLFFGLLFNSLVIVTAGAVDFVRRNTERSIDIRESILSRVKPPQRDRSSVGDC
jgi:hypothetical protein